MRSLRLFVLPLVLSLTAGCTGSFLGSPPTSDGQVTAIAAARVAARPLCRQLSQSLKPGEVADLRASLLFVGGAIAADPDAAEKTLTDLLTAKIDDAPMAADVAAIALLVLMQAPKEARTSTAAAIAQAAIAGCLARLDGNGGGADTAFLADLETGGC